MSNASALAPDLSRVGLPSQTGTWEPCTFTPMDFSNNCKPLEIKMDTTKNLFNPAANDGALTWVGLRMIPVALVLAAILTVVA